MTAKLGIRDGLLSAGVFGAVLFGLVSVDPRVHDHVSEVVSTTGVSPLSSRVGDLGSVLWDAARHQSVENAPLLIFATVGGALTLFMLRS